MRDRVPPTDELPLTALRYAAGELPPAEAAAFEVRLAHDQEARDALGEAIRLSAAALDRPTPAPDPLVREVVREALRPTVLSWLFPRRPYRGHPLAWAGLGGTVAAGLTALGVWLGDQPDDRTGPPEVVDVAPPANPDVGVPAGIQLVKSPDTPAPPDGAPSRNDRSASAADPAAEPESPGRAVASDAEGKPERIAPAPPVESKPTLQSDPGTK
ncbi:MAG TPA: hypothetical protein VFG68_05595 [Fimbriiglobus sp.]|nr:hypothetical protein [Fimbriiglobus sp.]